MPAFVTHIYEHSFLPGLSFPPTKDLISPGPQSTVNTGHILSDKIARDI